jgi:16S rRNA (cytosine1402-N4)-methyltransferase
MPDGSHVPVLARQVVEALVQREDGRYVDATFGRGGHARAILARLAPSARLYAFDRDPAAEEHARSIDDPRFSFARAWFSEAPAWLAAHGAVPLHGVLLDLGVSSPQLDDPARGFSLRFDGPLDMRMDPSRGESAAQWLARASLEELTEALRDYGEERLARPIAAAIVAARQRIPIERTQALAQVVREAVGARTRGDWRQDPATRTFQAVRIAVNEELAELSRALPAFAAQLAPRGRIAVISFHSLEDRIVKRFFAAHSKPFGGDERLARLPIRAAELPAPPLAPVGRAIRADDAECRANPRARSATLRVAERTGATWPAPAHGATS